MKTLINFICKQPLLLFVLMVIIGIVSCGNSSNASIAASSSVVDSLSDEGVVSEVEVLLDLNYVEEVPIYDNSGRVIATVHNDTIEENFVMIQLIDKNDSMYYVHISYSAYGEKEYIGWIYRSLPFITYTSTYSPDKQGFYDQLYSKPDENSAVVVKRKNYCSDPFQVIDFDSKHSSWIKVSIKEADGSISEGWLYSYCSNPYTTCC